MICGTPPTAMTTIQTIMTGPNQAATLAVPRRCAMNNMMMIVSVMKMM